MAGRRFALPLSVDARFREVGFGTWEGLTPDEIIASRPQEYAAFYQDPYRNRPPGAESIDDFGRRVAEAYEQSMEKNPGEHILVVAHAGVIRAALGHVLQSDPVAWYRARVDNAAFTRFRCGSTGTRLEFHNRLRLDG